jgi:hypothetical protein
MHVSIIDFLRQCSGNTNSTREDRYIEENKHDGHKRVDMCEVEVLVIFRDFNQKGA